MSDTKTIDGIIYDMHVTMNVPILHVNMTVMVDPSNAPPSPAIGDVWAEEVEDQIFFYIWDGFTWMEVFGQREEVEIEEPDTPEKAYERAMRVLK